MPQSKRVSSFRRIMAKTFFAVIFMSMMLMAEGLINGHGSLSASINLLDNGQAELSHATKALHFVVNLLTYSLSS